MSSLVRVLSGIAYRWVARQNKAFYDLGEPLSSEEKEALLPYFSPDVLNRTRKVFLNKVQPRGILTKFRLSLLKTIFRSKQLHGLTLADCVFLAPRLLSLAPGQLRAVLFHEMVHVMQYDLLGVKGFINKYLQSWADNGFSYEKISLERVAYGLTHHFKTFPERPFSVKERVLQGMEIQ